MQSKVKASCILPKEKSSKSSQKKNEISKKYSKKIDESQMRIKKSFLSHLSHHSMTPISFLIWRKRYIESSKHVRKMSESSYLATMMSMGSARLLSSYAISQKSGVRCHTDSPIVSMMDTDSKVIFSMILPRKM